MSQTLFIKTEYAGLIRWSTRGSCGNSGCTDPECGCAICGSPIGVNEDDPRWDTHSEYCVECELCRDSVPAILFRNKGESVEQAQFCSKCFEKAILTVPYFPPSLERDI